MFTAFSVFLQQKARAACRLLLQQLQFCLKPKKLKLKLNRVMSALMLCVQVDLVDEKGTRDPWAENRVSFKIEGPGKLLAVGNGNPRGLEPFTVVSSHPLYYGKAVAVVRRNKDATGPIRLTASVEGLTPATVEFP